MVVVNFCGECGEEIVDYGDVEIGLCLDCQMDQEDGLTEDTEDE